MKRISFKEDYKKIDSAITLCFKTAEKTDEAEFVISLLKHANLSPYDGRDTLKNFQELYAFLAEATLSGKFQAADLIRLSLLMYCHFFEWSEMYNLLYDLSKISKGERAGQKVDQENDNDRDLYWEELKKIVKGDLTPEKIENVRGILNKFDGGQLGINKKISIIKIENREIGEILEVLFDGVLRNGFSHNNYAFIDRGLIITNERTGESYTYSWDTINKLYNLTKCFAGCLMETWKSYLIDSSGKHLKGRYCEYKIYYGVDKKFKIELINGPIPLGIKY